MSGQLFLALPTAGFAGPISISAASYGLKRSIGGCSGIPRANQRSQVANKYAASVGKLLT